MPGLGVRGFKTSYWHSEGELCPKRRENNVFLSLFKNFGPGVPLFFMWFWSFRVFEGVTRALWAIGRVDHWNIHAGCGFWQSLPQTYLNRLHKEAKNNLIYAKFKDKFNQSWKISLFWIHFPNARSTYLQKCGGVGAPLNLTGSSRPSIVIPDKSCSRRICFGPIKIKAAKHNYGGQSRRGNRKVPSGSCCSGDHDSVKTLVKGCVTAALFSLQRRNENKKDQNWGENKNRRLQLLSGITIPSKM